MLSRYFRLAIRIEQPRSSTGGHLLEGFAKELPQGGYHWICSAQAHSGSGTLSPLDRPLKPVDSRSLKNDMDSSYSIIGNDAVVADIIHHSNLIGRVQCRSLSVASRGPGFQALIPSANCGGYKNARNRSVTASLC